MLRKPQLKELLLLLPENLLQLQQELLPPQELPLLQRRPNVLFPLKRVQSRQGTTKPENDQVFA